MHLTQNNLRDNQGLENQKENHCPCIFTTRVSSPLVLAKHTRSLGFMTLEYTNEGDITGKSYCQGNILHSHIR